MPSKRALPLTGLALLGTVAGYLLVLLPSWLFIGLFLVGFLIGATTPWASVPIGALAALPHAIDTAHSPFFTDADMRLISIGLAVVLAAAGSATGAMAHQFIRLALRASRNTADRSSFLALFAMVVLSLALRAAPVTEAFGFRPREVTVALLLFATVLLAPNIWLELTIAASLVPVCRALYSRANLLPFEVLASLVSIPPLLAVGALAIVSRKAWHRVRHAA